MREEGGGREELAVMVRFFMGGLIRGEKELRGGRLGEAKEEEGEEGGKRDGEEGEGEEEREEEEEGEGEDEEGVRGEEW